MKKSRELYDLIHSLTGSEKRFFKIYCSRHEISEKNNYVLLFDVFEGMSKFNEDKLKRSIEAADFVKHFAAEQNYLYNMVLECLDIYHKESSVDKQITKLTNIGRVLANKKLEAQSVKVLNKAKQLAESHYRFALLIPIYELQKRKHFSQDTITPNLLSEHYVDMENTLMRLSRSLGYKKVFDELMMLRRKVGFVINESVVGQIHAIFPSADQPDPTSFSSFDEEVFFLLSKMEYHRLIKKGDTRNYYPTKLIQLFESNVKYLTGVYIDHYIYALNVFIVSRMYKDEAEARVALSKVQQLHKVISKRDNTLYVKAKVFEVYYTCITDLALHAKSYDEVLNQYEEIEQRFAEVSKHLTPTFSLVLKSNLACVCFNAGYYKRALKWCHEVVNEAPRLREDVYYVMRILYLMIHFELDNQVILPSLIQSTSRYLSKRNRTHQFETVFIAHLKKLVDLDAAKARKAVFQSLRGAITPLQNHPYEGLAMQEIDVFGWIDKKMAS